MKVGDSMKTTVVTIAQSAKVRDAVLLFVNNHISMLPVLDKEGRPVGAVHLRDLLERVMPVFVDLIKDFDYVGDFGAIEDGMPEASWLEGAVTTVMEPIETVETSSGLVRAFSIMKKRDILDLPVVDREGRLAGLASRVDIGRALLTNWHVDVDEDRGA